jgi:hypothetical protein
LETTANLLMQLKDILSVSSKCSLKSLNNQADFDSAIRRFDPSRPSQTRRLWRISFLLVERPAADQPRRFFLAFFPGANFAGEPLAGCGCPAWPDLFRCFFFFPKPGSPANFDPLSR